MKTSTPTEAKPREPESILLIGPPGGGKTTLMLQFPDLVVLDCDQNLDGPESHLRRSKLVPDLSYSYDQVRYKDDGSPRPIEECFDHLLLVLAEIKKTKSFGTVGVDSLTMVNEFIIRKVLREQGSGKLIMEPHYWIPFKSHMLTLINRLRGLGLRTVLTCHEVILTRPDPVQIMQQQIIGYQPSVQGSIADYFGAFFTDMWRCEVRQAPAGPKFWAVTMRTKLSDLKNSLGLPSEIENPTYEKLKPYFKAA